MQNVILPLDTRIDTDSYDVTQSQENPSYKYKNSLVYNGVLSNMKYKTGYSLPTTTGGELNVSVIGSSIKINGRTVAQTTDRCIKAKTKIEPKISGEIVDIGIKKSGTGRTCRILYIIKADDGFYLCGRDCYYSSGNYTFTELEPIYICEDDGNHAAFIMKCSTNSSYVEAYYSAVAETQSGTTITRTHTLYEVTPDFEAGSYNSTLKYTKTMSIDTTLTTYKNFYLSGPINNGCRSGNNYTFGAEYNDQRKCWHFYNSGSPIEFFGCVDENGFVTGEPVPVCESYNDVYENDNGVLRWAMIPTDITVGVTSTDPLIAPTSYSDTKSGACLRIGLRNLCNEWIYGYKAGTAQKQELKVYNNASISTPSWTVQDITQDFGALEIADSATLADFDYDVFPNLYLFTNKRYNRGKVYDYGKGFSRFTLQTRGLAFSAYYVSGAYKILEKDVRPFLGQTFMFDCTDGKVRPYPLDYKGKFSVTNSACDSSLINAFMPSDNEVVADASVWSPVATSNIGVEYGRLINLTESNVKNKNWPTFTYAIGGQIDDGFINSFPSEVKTGNFTIQYYNGLPISASMNHCLIATPSDEIEHYTYTVQESVYYTIAIDKDVYFIENIGVNTQNVQIEKVADYLFKTNLLVQRNFIKENRDGTLDYVRAAIPYNNACEINRALVMSLDLYQPNVGSTANDTFLLGAGCNVNLDDKDVSASYLLPAVNIPIYVDTSDLEKFNQEVIKNRNPLIVPYIKNLFENEEVDVYFTHNLYSTDVTYKTTYIRNNYDINEALYVRLWAPWMNAGTEVLQSNISTLQTYDYYKTETYKDELTDNSWWLTAEIIIFPIAIGSDILGANYVTPTIELDGNYTAQLYNKNNVTFLIFNSAQQVYYGNQIFTIYTNSYYYDGQAIYYIGGTNQLTQNEFVCYALGMRFLCNSGTEAYFWSDWEKKLYVFTGSNTMQAADSFSRFDELLDSVYSSKEQALYLLFSKEDDEGDVYDGYDRWLIVRTQKDSFMIPLMSEGLDLSLNTTSDGAAVIFNRANKSVAGYYAIKPHTFENTWPLHIETEWIGDDGTLTKFTYVDIMVYKIAENQTIDVTTAIRNGNEVETETTTYELSPDMWKGSLYRMRITPKENIGTAFKVTIDSKDLAAISYISVGLEPTSNIPGAPTRRR